MLGAVYMVTILALITSLYISEIESLKMFDYEKDSFVLLVLVSISCKYSRMDPVVDTLRVEPLLPNDEREVDLI